MLLQTGVIFFLSFWIYEEYQRNVYLQAYLTNILGGSFLPIVGGFSAFFSSLVLVLYIRLHRTRKELDEVLLAEAPGQTSKAAGFLDRRTEEHLIELIRKKNQAENLGTVGNTSVLRRVDQNQDNAN